MVKCITCGTIAQQLCPDCEQALCLVCQQRYEVNSAPRICWLCQSAIDRAWVSSNFTAIRRTEPKNATH